MNNWDLFVDKGAKQQLLMEVEMIWGHTSRWHFGGLCPQMRILECPFSNLFGFKHHQRIGIYYLIEYVMQHNHIYIIYIYIYNINVNIYTYIAFILVGVSISSSKFFPKGPQQHIQGFQTNLFFFWGVGRPKPTTTWRCSLRAMLRSMNCWEIPENWLLRVETEFCCICKGTFVLFNVPLGLKDLVVKLMGLHEILVTEYRTYYSKSHLRSNSRCITQHPLGWWFQIFFFSPLFIGEDFQFD